MTVAELIAELRKMPQNLEVYVFFDDITGIIQPTDGPHLFNGVVVIAPKPRAE